MSEILVINNLWGGYKEGVDILRGISIEIRQGDSVGIIGLNGSGKSTFGKAIMNMIPFRRGDIFFEGEDITVLSTSQLARRGISIMQQGGKVFPNLSVWDNLQLAIVGKRSMVNSQWSMVKKLVPLLQRSKKELQFLMADKLSGGQKHQLSLAMTLASNPHLIILDEPSAGLSPIAVEEMYQMLHNVRKKLNITIMLIEQNIVRAMEFCDKSCFIQQGNICKIFLGNDIAKAENFMFRKEAQNV